MIRKYYDAAHEGGSSKDELVERFNDVLDMVESSYDTAQQCLSITRQYAEETAVAFDEWKLKNGYQRYSDTQWISHRGEYYTPSKLYTIFYNERNQKKP